MRAFIVLAVAALAACSPRADDPPAKADAPAAAAKLEPITDNSGAISDVKISYPCDLTTQMLEYSEQ